MKLLPTRPSKRRRAMKAAGKAAKKGMQAKAVQRAPKTAAAVWAGRRSGKVVRAAAFVLVAVIVVRVARSAMSSGGPAEQPAEPSYRSTPTPASGQQTGGAGGGASGPAPGGPTVTELAKEAEQKHEGQSPKTSATPPHGDPLSSEEGAPGSEPASERAGGSGPV